MNVTETPLSFRFALTPERYPVNRTVSFQGEIKGHDLVFLEAKSPAR